LRWRAVFASTAPSKNRASNTPWPTTLTTASGAAPQSASVGGSLATAGSPFARAKKLSDIDPTPTLGQVAPVLECVINVSEGRNAPAIEAISSAAGACLLDVHTDPWHNRTVLTIAGPGVEQAARSVAQSAVSLLDITEHAGANPRLGVIDVVPFVPITLTPTMARDPSGGPTAGSVDLSRALAARDAFATYAAFKLGVPCFLYGPERSLPEVRRRAFVTDPPDTGPPVAHPTAGAICVGAREVLIAYNVWLAVDDLYLADEIARAMRSTQVRALALEVGGRAQVSCNLVEPWSFGPTEAFDFVAGRAPVAKAELVGLLPASVLESIPADRWPELDLGEDRTIEGRLSERDFSANEDPALKLK
jgi:glutamate formiminotransferase